jgi:vanillate O-demethylase monooxygenase subunit
MPFLRNAWYVAAWAGELAPTTLLRRRLLGEYYVLFRDGAGTPKALVDRCPHRFAPLSKGKIVGDGATIQCGYHGLQFSSDGRCVHNPHGPVPHKMAIRALPLVEKYSAIWAWLGEPGTADPALIPHYDFLVPETHAVACDRITIEGHYELETDNIMDLSHIEYMHPMFSSPAVSQGRFECVLDGDTVWSKRLMTNDDLPPFLHAAFGFAPGQKADRWLNVRWDAPACMALWAGAVESGRPQEEGRVVPGAHIFTPETENSTHYFFATSFPWSAGPNAMQLALAGNVAATGVFTHEDKPMIEAQADNMQGHEFWSMNPMLLSIDAAAVRTRRILAKKIAQENAGAQ